MGDVLPRSDSQSSISSIFSDATNSNIDEELILSDATDSEDDLDQTAIREESILDSDKTVEDIDAPESEEIISIVSANDADDEHTTESIEKVTKDLKKTNGNIKHDS